MNNAFEDIGGNSPALAVQQVQAAPSALANTDQGRAVAEAQAALVIAQARPRNEVKARDKIMQACQRTSLAQVAVYAFPRGGQSVSGPSVRLAETMARAWGNMSYGFRELNRATGNSEVEAYAWDLETNTKAVRQFAVRHLRDKRGGPVALTDERDIYEMIANQAQRRVRACILEIIPGDITEDAVKQCEKTLSAAVASNGRSLDEVVQSMIQAFEGFGVNKGAIEKRLGHRTESIQPAEVLRLREIYASIKDGFSTAGEWFEMDDAESPADHTSDILKRAAKGQDDHSPDQVAPTNGQTRNKPTKAEMEQRREEAKAAVLEAGLNLEDVEKDLNAFTQNWSTAQCERAKKMAADALAAAGVVPDPEAEAEPAAPEPPTETTQAEAQQESFECPNNGAMVRLSVECAACDQMGQCPMTDGQE